MKELEQILSNIDSAVDSYNTLPVFNSTPLAKVLQSLTSNLYYLEKHRIEAYNNWHEVYFTCKQTSDAAKTKWADQKIPELYKIRRLQTSAYKIVEAIRSQISLSKKENN